MPNLLSYIGIAAIAAGITALLGVRGILFETAPVPRDIALTLCIVGAVLYGCGVIVDAVDRVRKTIEFGRAAQRP